MVSYGEEISTASHGSNGGIVAKKYEGIDITDLAVAMVEHTQHCLFENSDGNNNDNNNDKKSRVDILEGDTLFEWVKKGKQ